MSEEIEKLSAEIHKVYCAYYQERHGKPYWTNGDYNLLDEQTKDADRFMARFILNRKSPANNTEHAKITGNAGKSELKPGATDWNKGGKLAVDYFNRGEDAGLAPIDEKEIFNIITDNINWSEQEGEEKCAKIICAKFGTNLSPANNTEDANKRSCDCEVRPCLLHTEDAGLYHISEKMTYDFFANIRNTAGLKVCDLIDPLELMDNVKVFCSRFGHGTKPGKELTYDEILGAIKSIKPKTFSGVVTFEAISHEIVQAMREKKDNN